MRLEDDAPPPAGAPPPPPPFRGPGGPGPARDPYGSRAARASVGRPGLGRAGAREKKRRPWGWFVLANALPAAGAVFWFTRSEEQRRHVLDQIPQGTASRAIAAGAALVVLLLLAFLVLPAARATLAALARAQTWFRTRRTAVRIAIFPAELVVGLAWFLAQVLFAIDAFAILAAGAALILYTLRIVKPDWFPWLPG